MYNIKTLYFRSFLAVAENALAITIIDGQYSNKRMTDHRVQVAFRAGQRPNLC